MRKRYILPGIVFALVASPAFAHPGHPETGFGAGLMHPLTGLDHALAMLAVGLWAGLAFGKRAWTPVAVFPALMLAGFAYGYAGGVFPGTEGLIAASLLALGAAALFQVKPPAALAAAVVALFAAAHGFAHGVEAPRGGNPLGFAAGFTLATLTLHAAGLGLAAAAKRFSAEGLARAAGGGIAMAGLTMAFWT